MKRRTLAAVLIAGLVLALTGCMRYNSIYYIQSDGTVSGQIYTAIKEGYQTDSDPYKGTGAGDIAAQFPGATITNETSAPWYAYRVSFSNAPLSAFSAVPTESWQVKITKSGNVYKVLGYDTSQTSSATHDAIPDHRRGPGHAEGVLPCVSGIGLRKFLRGCGSEPADQR